jgi:predicted transcriptional regulator
MLESGVPVNSTSRAKVIEALTAAEAEFRAAFDREPGPGVVEELRLLASSDLASRRIRAKLHMTDVAKRAGVSTSTVKQAEEGLRVAPLTLLAVVTVIERAEKAQVSRHREDAGASVADLIESGRGPGIKQRRYIADLTIRDLAFVAEVSEALWARAEAGDPVGESSLRQIYETLALTSEELRARLRQRHREDDLRQELAASVRKKRVALGLTQEQLASAAWAHAHVVRRVESAEPVLADELRPLIEVLDQLIRRQARRDWRSGPDALNP